MLCCCFVCLQSFAAGHGHATYAHAYDLGGARSLLHTRVLMRPARGLPMIRMIRIWTPWPALMWGSCLPVIKGCTNAQASNFESFFNTDDGRCRRHP